MAIQQDPQQQIPNLTIWDNRWNDLQNTLDLYANCYGLKGELALPRKQTIDSLLNRLKAFGGKQFATFRNNLGQMLEYTGKFPAEYICKVIIDQSSNDLEVILRAADRRQSCPGKIRLDLDKADRFAQFVLQPAIEANLVEGGSTSLCYLQKHPSARIVPYGPIVLIGLPFTSGSIKRDLLAIPHEVGHYVYRYGQVGGERIYKTLDDSVPKNPIWVRRWTEEIFADIYGCLVGGPVMALSSQHLALQYYSLEKFTETDGDHPAPPLRPSIYAKVINEQRGTRQQNDPLASALLTAWNDRLDRRGKPTQIKLRNGNGRLINQTISPGLGIDPDNYSVDLVIRQVLDLLGGIQLNEYGSLQLDNLDADFSAFLESESITGQSLTELPPLPAAQTLWEDWVQEEKFFVDQNGNGLTPSQVDHPILEGQLESLDDNPNGAWIHLLYAAGWSTEIGDHRNP